MFSAPNTHTHAPPQVRRHVVNTYVLEVQTKPSKRGSPIGDYEKMRRLIVDDVDNLSQLMDDISARLGLRSTSRKMLQADPGRHTCKWKPLHTLSELRPSPYVAVVAFEATAHRSVPRVESGGAAAGRLTRAQKESTLRRYYHSVGDWKTDSEIQGLVGLYSSEYQWDAQLTKLQRKYRKPVELWTRGTSWHVPERRSQTAAFTPRAPVPRETTEFVCCRYEILRRAMVQVTPCAHCTFSYAASSLGAQSSRKFEPHLVLVAGCETVMMKISGPDSWAQLMKGSVEAAIARVNEGDEKRAALERKEAREREAREREARAALATRPRLWEHSARSPLTGTASSFQYTAPTLTDTASSLTTSGWCEEVLTVPEMQEDLVKVVTGEHNDNLPSGVIVIRTALGGAIEFKICGNREIVDNVKALIGSILEADAHSAQTTAPTPAHEQSETSLDVPHTPVLASSTGPDDTGAAGAQRPDIDEGPLLAAAEFASRLVTTDRLSSDDSRTAEQLFARALAALQTTDYEVILSDQLDRIGFQSFGKGSLLLSYSSADVQEIKRVGEICAGLATASSFEEAWKLVDKGSKNELSGSGSEPTMDSAVAQQLHLSHSSRGDHGGGQELEPAVSIPESNPHDLDGPLQPPTTREREEKDLTAALELSRQLSEENKRREAEAEAEAERNTAAQTRSSDPALTQIAEFCQGVMDPVDSWTRGELTDLLKACLRECKWEDLLSDRLRRAGFMGEGSLLCCDLKTEAGTIHQIGAICERLAVAATWEEAFEACSSTASTAPQIELPADTGQQCKPEWSQSEPEPEPGPEPEPEPELQTTQSQAQPPQPPQSHPQREALPPAEAEQIWTGHIDSRTEVATYNPIGLPNVAGADCFWLATLQCIRHTPRLCEIFAATDVRESSNDPCSAVFCGLSALFAAMTACDNAGGERLKPDSPELQAMRGMLEHAFGENSPVQESPKLQRQQCAHEFFSKLIDVLGNAVELQSTVEATEPDEFDDEKVQQIHCWEKELRVAKEQEDSTAMDDILFKFAELQWNCDRIRLRSKLGVVV
eukprot:COSAG02_NODE_6975_length_3255_cov_4.227503_1_plen_1052_part_01